jgi:hypothetical protein
MWNHPRTDEADNATHDAGLLKCQIIVCVVFSKKAQSNKASHALSNSFNTRAIS